MSTGCDIGDAGAAAFCEVLKTNSVLTKLDLSCESPLQLQVTLLIHARYRQQYR